MDSRKIVIIEYNMGNLGSIRNMLSHLGFDSVISADILEINEADKLILSGVGSFDEGMRSLTEKKLKNTLTRRVLEDHIPILGICLGMQLFSRKSEEGTLHGLGWLEARTIRFNFPNSAGKLKIPHMGWNTISIEKPSPLLTDMVNEPRFYFVHSYHLECDNTQDVLCRTVHGYDFTSAVACGNIYGVQFHPEKSHRFGMQILKNFVELS